MAATTTEAPASLEHRIHDWFYEGSHDPSTPHAGTQHTAHWSKVMCLTGVDYFSTLAYQPDPLRRPRVHVG